MKRIIFLILGLTILTAGLYAGEPFKTAAENNPEETFSCNLPAPATLNITNITAHSATGTWSAVPGAVAYLVEVERVSNSTIVYSNTVAALTETATGLPDGEEMIFRVTPICPGGEASPNSKTGNFTTDIGIDLIVVNYQAPCPGNTTIDQITYNAPGDDEYILYITKDKQYYVDVYQTGNSNDIHHHKFLVSYEGNTNQIQAYKSKIQTLDESDPLGTLFGFDAQYNSYYDIYLFGYALLKKPGGSEPMLHYSIGGSLSHFSSYAIFSLKAISAGWDTHNGIYNITIIECPSEGGGGPKGGSGDRNDLMSGESGGLVIAPNPFTDELMIFNGGDEEVTNANITLMDISGKTVSQNNAVTILPGGQYLINTGNLANGMYLLKTEINGTVKTQKVVKTGGER